MFLQQLYNALAVSALYVAVALGITLIYGLTGLLNIAVAQLLTLGGFVTYSLTKAGVPFWPSLLCAAICVGLVSEASDLVLLRRTIDRPINGFVITLGMVLALQAAFVLIWGTDVRSIAPPFPGVWKFNGMTFDRPRAVVIGITFAACAILYLVLERTRVGRGLKALTADRPTARLMGIAEGRYISAVFLIGSAFVGMTGGLLATAYPFDAFSGFQVILTAFAIAIVGGLGSVKGTIVAGLVFAIAQTLAAAYISQEWSELFALAAAMLLLVVRPQGLFRSGSGSTEGHFILRGAAIARQYAIAPPRWDHRISRRSVGVLVVLVAIVCVPAVLTGRELSVATNGLIMAMAAFAFSFGVRSAGIFSMAPAAFAAVGAYTAGYVGSHFSGVDFVVQALASTLAGVLCAVVIGLVAFRSRGASFAILTLIIAQIIGLISSNWSNVTGGELGKSVPGFPKVFGISVNTPDRLFVTVTVSFILAVAVLAIYERSQLSWHGRMVRENHLLAASLGINVQFERLLVFGLSGAISGMAGALAFYYLRFVEPGTFDVLFTTNIILIAVLGGIAYWVGPLLGAVVFAFAPEILSLGPNWTNLAYGLVLIVVMLLAPNGLPAAGVALTRFAKQGAGFRRSAALADGGGLASEWLASPQADDPNASRSHDGSDAVVKDRYQPQDVE